MLGYDVTIHHLSPSATRATLDTVSALPYGEGVRFAKALTGGVAARVPGSAWIDPLLDVVQAGHASLVHDGGYPYLIHARGSDITKLRDLAGLPLASDEWYLVEAWDQS